MRMLFIITAFLPLFCQAQPTTNSRDTCGDYFYQPVNTTEMRIMYLSAKAGNDGYALMGLAKIENENQFLPDIQGGDILKDAYSIGIKKHDPELLYNIATYENAANLMDLKAGDILYDAYDVAMYKKNAFILFKIAAYENTANLMDAKAGDILYDAYRIALTNKDVSTLYKISYYERQNDLIKLKPEEIIREIGKIRF